MPPVSLLFELCDEAGARVARGTDVARLRIRASFGALPSRCVLELDPDQTPFAPAPGASLAVWLDDAPVFRGPLQQRAVASGRPPRQWTAVRAPARALDTPAAGAFDNAYPHEVLQALWAQTPHLAYTLAPPSPSLARIDRLRFARLPLVYAVDLLARLDGNRLWDIDWSGNLRWRPADSPADHVLYLDARRHALLWGDSDAAIVNSWEFHGGADAHGNEFRRQLEHPASIARYGRRRGRLFARAISTPSAFARLAAALLAHLPLPARLLRLEVFDGMPAAQAGDILELRGDPLHARARVKTVEHDWRAGRLATRLYFAAGLESASRYTRYLDHDPVAAPRLLGRLALDRSALDSGAHID